MRRIALNLAERLRGFCTISSRDGAIGFLLGTVVLRGVSRRLSDEVFPRPELPVLRERHEPQHYHLSRR